MVAPTVKRAGDYRAARIGPRDMNDPAHSAAHEMFFILEGSGMAQCDGTSVPIAKGDAVLLGPTGVHVIENTGPGKLSALCVMVPNEGFAELIHGGTPVALGTDDLAVLRGAGLAA